MYKLNFWNWMGSHPQKSLLKTISIYIYIIGGGDCWYEKKKRSLFKRTAYIVWSIIVNMYLIMIIVDQCFSFYAIKLNVKERNDLIQMVFGQTTIYLKVVVFMMKKKHIETVLEKLLNENRDVYTSITLDRASVKKALFLIGMMIIFVYATVASATYNAIKVEIAEGLPIQIAVTYYPNASSTGKYIHIIRFFVELHWWYMVTAMYGVDSLSYCSLVFVEYKFKTLQEYYRHLKKYFLENTEGKSQDEQRENIKKYIIAGIRLHESALWCAKNIQSSLGNIYSIQVIQSIGLLVNCLIKLVTEERDVTFLIANMTFISTMIFMTGSYMIPSGDITWEANELSTAIFDCGWELSKGKLNRELRTLLVVAIQRSQVPVYMTAFGVIILSYTNFISVLRSSYSFFAVMY